MVISGKVYLTEGFDRSTASKAAYNKPDSATSLLRKFCILRHIVSIAMVHVYVETSLVMIVRQQALLLSAIEIVDNVDAPKWKEAQVSFHR